MRGFGAGTTIRTPQTSMSPSTSPKTGPLPDAVAIASLDLRKDGDLARPRAARRRTAWRGGGPLPRRTLLRVRLFWPRTDARTVLRGVHILPRDALTYVL